MRCVLIKEVLLPFDTVLKKLPRELRRRGFKLLSTINVDKELHDSLGVEYKQCALLTISNLQLAYKTLLREEESAILHFLQLFIFEKNGTIEFAIFRPTQLFPILQSNYLEDETSILEKKLMEVIDTFCRKSVEKGNKKETDNMLKAVA
ncbi:MAG TPA: hypothetical protein VHP36_01850 [Chitinispirillaceae bacterium]|nr:hypothetical protein [Chitinispirillaceae bacterium]